MAMGSFNTQGAQAPMADINMTPMVDVMLVLLVIFIIAAPLMTHSVQVKLPQASSQPTPDKPTVLAVAISADNRIEIDGKALAGEALEARFRDAVAADAKVEMQLKADRNARYEAVAETMSAARRAGLEKIGFITQPGPAAR